LDQKIPGNSAARLQHGGISRFAFEGPLSKGANLPARWRRSRFAEACLAPSPLQAHHGARHNARRDAACRAGRDWEDDMSVAHILASKGHDVVTARRDASLGDIARTLAEHGIGAVVIAGPGREVLGIVSERDVVRAIAAAGPSALNEKVERYMTTKVRFGHEQMTIVEAMEHMTHGRFRHLPVVDGTRLIGVVSIGDIVKYRLAEIESETRAMREYIASA
jgi:CBS domain-containing protein